MQKWRDLQYYIIIGVASFAALFFLPMIGTEIGLKWNIPNTVPGWIVYVTSKALAAIINILIFHCFIKQAETNIKDNPKYKEAKEIIQSSDPEKSPRSPDKWKRDIYTRKGSAVLLASILSSVGLAQAILVFDWIALLTYLFTLAMGIILGVIQMNAAEEYWTEEFYDYAKKIQKERKESEDD